MVTTGLLCCRGQFGDSDCSVGDCGTDHYHCDGHQKYEKVHSVCELHSVNMYLRTLILHQSKTVDMFFIPCLRPCHQDAVLNVPKHNQL